MPLEALGSQYWTLVTTLLFALCLSLSSQVDISRVPWQLRHEEYSAAAVLICSDGQLHFTPLISHQKKNSVMTEQLVWLQLLCLQAR